MNHLLPTFFYGTAWKKERTAELTQTALASGFRAIDTANQLKHYDEAGVGQAVQNYLAAGNRRESIFLQTKFTSMDGQDHRLPYDAKANLTIQVRQSFESSCKHLGVSSLDSYLLHGPYGHPGLNSQDWEVWSAIEQLKTEGRSRYIGVSNFNPSQLIELIKHSKIKPQMVQNRCFANRGWDSEVREICRQSQITYQGFSLLTANPQVLEHSVTLKIAKRLDLNSAQVVFAFSKKIGILPLTGTSNPEHMKADLIGLESELSEEETAELESIACRY